MHVSEKQRELSRKAEREPHHRFADLYRYVCDLTWLRSAHDHVAQNQGSVTGGCDGVTMAIFDRQLEQQLERLREDLRHGMFEPYPVRRVYIQKTTGKLRPLGILTIRGRIVQETVRMVLEPIFEADFSPNSYGFRPNRRTMDAIKAITLYTTNATKYFWAIEGDIASCFDSIHHKKLLKLVQRRVKDQRLLALIQKVIDHRVRGVKRVP